MRIVFYIPSLSVSGAQKAVVLLAKKLSETEDVFVIANTGKIKNQLTQMLEESNVRLLFTKGKSGRSIVQKLDSLRMIFGYFNSIKPDVINVHLDVYYTWVYSLFFRRKIIFTVHNDAERFYGLVNQYLFSKLNEKNLIEYILLSKSNETKFCKICNMTRNRTHVASNPIDLSLYKVKKEKKKDIGSEDLIYINVARFHPIKNHVMLLNAFRIVLSELKNAKLWLIGDGDKLDEIKQYAKKICISQSCVFFGEIEDTERKLFAADIAVLSSKSECLPMFIIESMAAGLPIVSTDVGGVKDMIEGNGFVVQEGNAKELASRMIELGKNKTLRTEMGNKSYNLVEKYDVNRVGEIYKKIFQSVIESRH